MVWQGDAPAVLSDDERRLVIVTSDVVRHIDQIRGFARRSDAITITHVVVGKRIFDALTISHELMTGQARYLRDQEELVALVCVLCGCPVQLKWRASSNKAPVIYTDLDDPHTCAGRPSDV